MSKKNWGAQLESDWRGQTTAILWDPGREPLLQTGIIAATGNIWIDTGEFFVPFLQLFCNFKATLHSNVKAIQGWATCSQEHNLLLPALRVPAGPPVHSCQKQLDAWTACLTGGGKQAALEKREENEASPTLPQALFLRWNPDRAQRRETKQSLAISVGWRDRSQSLGVLRRLELIARRGGGGESR